MDKTTIVVQILVTIGVVFGGSGFWAYLDHKLLKKNGLDGKIDQVIKDVEVVKKRSDDTIAYRKEREEKEKLEQAIADQNIELLKKANAVALEKMLDELFDTVNESKVYTLEQRDKGHLVYKVYLSLGYDGRQAKKYEIIRTFPDEYGVVHPITDQERDEMNALHEKYDMTGKYSQLDGSKDMEVNP